MQIIKYLFDLQKNQIIQINKMSAFEKMALAFKSKEFDAISSSLLSSDSSPSIFKFTQNKKLYSYDVTFVYIKKILDNKKLSII